MFSFFFSIFSSGGYFVQPSGAGFATLLCYYFEIKPLTEVECILKFVFLFLAAILFSQAEPF